MKTDRANLRAQVRAACDVYFRRLTDPGWTPEDIQRSARELAAYALRLHLFEQGYRAALKEKE